ncbi:MdfA family multidrug efflux MFS transporter [Chitinilyticum litopenaei]|uniref:MdfA family multidrug efflux MFS transporter n=1 Tax=Chitinilyticum litopenaei TaxID=1121276 RepID=UPI00041A5257|nr:MdfA family multidrug efflux MFS transporter [Chitinilyticum litopenaei]
MSRTPHTTLTLRTLLFPLALVLYEFATYIGNDMILPGMPAVLANFGADPGLAPSSMSAYLAGGVALQWLLGPLSDRIGRRPVMLAGASFFVFSCLAILLSGSMASFLVWRFIQGFGLCYLVAVGYAAIQESFDEIAAIRVTAMMANVALISPLIGPLAGAVVIEYASWHWVFILIAMVAALGLAGLYFAMPETSPRVQSPLRVGTLWQEYRSILGSWHFLSGALALAAAGLPLLAWLGQSPVILMTDRQLSALAFGYWQIPIFAGLITGNVLLAWLVSRMRLVRLLWLAMPFLLGGLALALLASFAFPESIVLLVAGFSVYALGCGMASAGLYRLVLFASTASKGAVAAALGMVTLLSYTMGIEIARLAYIASAMTGFLLLTAASGIATVWLLRQFLRAGQRAQEVPVPAPR